jgi:hypothetical protein
MTSPFDKTRLIFCGTSARRKSCIGVQNGWRSARLSSSRRFSARFGPPFACLSWRHDARLANEIWKNTLASHTSDADEAQIRDLQASWSPAKFQS